MIRRLGFVVLAVALMVSACGRQVTPDRLSTTLGGTMQVKFLVNGPLNFSSYSYVVVFNTDGTSGSAATQTPLATNTNSNYQNFGFAMVVTDVGGNPTATPYVFFRPNGNQNYPPQLYPVPTVNGQVQFQANSNGLGTQFSFTFPRNIVAFLASSTPTPTPTPTPTATPTGATPTPTPTATPTPTPSPSTSPSTSPSPGSSPSVTNVWYVNFFTVQGNIGQSSALNTGILDSLGSGGATDATWVSPELDVDTPLNIQITAQLGIPPSDPAAEIMGGNISNTP